MTFSPSGGSVGVGGAFFADAAENATLRVAIIWLRCGIGADGGGPALLCKYLSEVEESHASRAQCQDRGHAGAGLGGARPDPGAVRRRRSCLPPELQPWPPRRPSGHPARKRVRSGKRVAVKGNI